MKSDSAVHQPYLFRKLNIFDVMRMRKTPLLKLHNISYVHTHICLFHLILSGFDAGYTIFLADIVKITSDELGKKDNNRPLKKLGSYEIFQRKHMGRSMTLSTWHLKMSFDF
jgi:hypothetical protein